MAWIWAAHFACYSPLMLNAPEGQLCTVATMSSELACSILIQGCSLGRNTCGSPCTHLPECWHFSDCQITVMSPLLYSFCMIFSFIDLDVIHDLLNRAKTRIAQCCRQPCGNRTGSVLRCLLRITTVPAILSCQPCFFLSMPTQIKPKPNGIPETK